ncbi:hypothetical protein [Piscinibacter sp. XHJ-5]|uniref:hypothetical protein n=1 Tax=Piscinibacter sp. XHJ-5 TaxID=3037797 RepID=UPI00245306D4|nr:hypothetical protein [Piscinibacter sp. XHJ-5]
MKHTLQALIVVAACGAGAAHAAQETHNAGTTGIEPHADTLTAFNFPKITYTFGGSAAHTQQEADKAATPGIDVEAGTTTCLNFPKITFIHANAHPAGGVSSGSTASSATA